MCNKNTVELTDYKLHITYELTDEQLDNFLNEMLDNMLINCPESVYNIKVVSIDCGVVLDHTISEKNYNTIFNYIKENIDEENIIRFQRKEDWARRPQANNSEYDPVFKYVTTADEIERAQTEGDEIKYQKIRVK